VGKSSGINEYSAGCWSQPMDFFVWSGLSLLAVRFLEAGHKRLCWIGDPFWITTRKLWVLGV
jgi:hypothetical protein